MEVGTVFLWDNFPFSKLSGSSIKPRWFIYLGKTTITSSPIFVFLGTTTTQLHYYESNGERCGHLFIKFGEGEFGFEKDCVLDLDKDLYVQIKESIFLSFEEDINIKGKLSEQKLREIYNLILKSRRIPKIIKRDIHHSFNMAGISGLRKPR